MLAHTLWASHTEKVAGCVAIHLFKGMLDKINRRALLSGLPMREARRQRPEEEALDRYPAAVVLRLHSKAFLLSRLRRFRLHLSVDKEGRRQDQRPQVWTNTIRVRSIQLAEISKTTMGWRQEQRISICCASHPTASQLGLRIKDRQPKIDVPRTLRGSRSRMLGIGG